MRAMVSAIFTVRGISFTLERGKKMLIVGSNNSGASSLVKNVLGWQKILTGEVFINGENCTDKFF
jgi:ATP-binding cassette subfamily B protein